MELINPITFSYGMLTSASVGEDDDYSAWSNITPYVEGDRVYLTSTHLIYECLIAHTGTSPDTSIAPVASPKWLVFGATNKYRAFDAKWGTQTTAASTLTLTLAPGVPITSLGLINLAGSNVHVRCTVGVEVKYDEYYILQTDVGVYSWDTYFLAPIVAQDDLVMNDLLPYATQVIEITIIGPSTVGIGNVTMGANINLGHLQYSPTIGIVSYSTKEFDDYGNVIIVPRAYAKRFSCSIAIDTSFVDQIASILASVRDTPCLWAGSGSDFSSLIVWGFVKDFEVDLAGPTLSFCTLTIEGLT